MNKQPVYKTKFSFLIYLVIFSFFFAFALYVDYDENRAFFTRWFYYLFPIIIAIVNFVVSLPSKTKLIIYESGLELSSHLLGGKLYFNWSDITRIEFRINRFIEIVIFHQQKGIPSKKNTVFTHISKKEVIKVLSILYINGIDVVALGHINKSWRNDAEKVAKSYHNRLTFNLFN